MERHGALPALEHNLLWGGAMAVFFFIPVYFLVVGHGNEPFDRAWFLDSAERARYSVVAKRMAVWFVSAAFLGILWSPLVSVLLRSAR